MKLIKKCILLYYKLLIKLFRTNKKMVVFQSSLGREYCGNPKAVYEEMIRQGLDKTCRCYYILDKPAAACLPGRIKKVKNGRLRYYYVMAAAGIWVSDTRFQNYIVKRKETVYIQTWHGTPLKKLALDMEKLNMAEGEDIAAYQREFCRNSSTWDYLVVQNSYSSEIFRNAFAFKGIFLRTGYPRNDILFRKDAEVLKRGVRQKYHIPDGKKIMLYAPTWRDDAFYNKKDYKFTMGLDFHAMKDAFEKEYVLILKLHYVIEDRINLKEYGNFIINAGKCDIAELYFAADLLITDYSSVMFDYSILKKPMFFYVYDYDKYKDELRGFYFDLLKEAPGPVISGTAELIEAVKNYRMRKHQEAYDAFSYKYHEYEKGNASEQIVNKMIDIIGGHSAGDNGKLY